MSATVSIAELDPTTRQRVLAQIEETESVATGMAPAKPAGVSTVVKETFTTLTNPAELGTNELADIVIEGLKKLRDCLPYIIELKYRFDAGERDNANHLTTPIKDCSSWKEFCQQHLGRTPQAVGQAIARRARPEPKKDPTPEQQAVRDLRSWQKTTYPDLKTVIQESVYGVQARAKADANLMLDAEFPGVTADEYKVLCEALNELRIERARHAA